MLRPFGIPHKSVAGVTDAGEVAFADSYTPGQSMVVQRFVAGPRRRARYRPSAATRWAAQPARRTEPHGARW